MPEPEKHAKTEHIFHFWQKGGPNVEDMAIWPYLSCSVQEKAKENH